MIGKNSKIGKFNLEKKIIRNTALYNPLKEQVDTNKEKIINLNEELADVGYMEEDILEIYNTVKN